ncbi:MAG: LapA family protein [Hyphomicrobiaceae bacterium]|nr:MAG: LapA family protein [Hyphomicrobiaceae bacterium]
MAFLKRLIWLLAAVPLGAVLIAIAVANRQTVLLRLDPFRPENPLIGLSLPLYAYIFAALFAGMIIGGVAVWLGQGKWRKRVRQRTHEANKWYREAARLEREARASDADGGSRSNLPVPAR